MLSANLEPVGRVRFGKTLLLAMLTGSAAALILIEIAAMTFPRSPNTSSSSPAGGWGRPEIKLKVKDLERLQDYDWPGNVRELQNMMERAVILSKGDRLRVDLALATTATRSPSRTASLPRAARMASSSVS